MKIRSTIPPKKANGRVDGSFPGKEARGYVLEQ
jgi:hypothetical protein